MIINVPPHLNSSGSHTRGGTHCLWLAASTQ